MITSIKTSTVPDIDRYNGLYSAVENARRYEGKVTVMGLKQSKLPVGTVLEFGAPELKTKIVDQLYSIVQHIPTSVQVKAILTDLYPEETIELTVVRSQSVLNREEIYPFILQNRGYYLVYEKWDNGTSENHVVISNEPHDLNSTSNFCYYFYSKNNTNLDSKIKFMEYNMISEYLKKLESI
jgi:hypothetical protein